MFAEEHFAAQAASLVVRLSIHRLGGPISPAQFANICSLTQLQTLYINHDLICARPPFDITAQIGQLTNLRELGIGSYSPDGAPQLSLPLECTALQSLTKLQLYGVEAPFLVLTRLSRLSELNLSGQTSMAAWPKEIGGLTSLASLEFTCGHLQSLSAFTALTRLHFGYGVSLHPTSSAAVLSHALGQITSLVALCFTGLPFAMQLGVLTGLSSLTSISADSCQIGDFECCSNWVNLASLQLAGNLCTHLPGNLSALTALTCLDVSQQRVDSFQLVGPLDFVAHMPHLRQLRLFQSHRHRWSSNSLFYLAAADAKLISAGVTVKYLSNQNEWK